MPFELELPHALSRQGWKVKIRERERLEPPHVTVIRRSRAWRFSLRTERFLDPNPPPGDVPGAVRTHIVENLAELRAAWDAMYPENSVGGPR